MLPRRPACAVSLTTLPQECLIQICALLPARTLTTLSACSALLQRASSDDLLWLRLCQIDYGVDARHCLPAFPYTTVRGFYVGVLQKWGWTLGAWQANYPFFTGQLLHVRVDPLYSRIVGEKLTVDISGLDETSAAPVAPLPGVSMDKLAVQLERKAVFEIRFEKAEHVDSSLNSLWSQRMPGAGQSPLCTRDMLFGEWDDNDDTDDGGDSGSSSFVAAAGVPVTVSTVAPVLTHVDAPPASPYDQEGVVSYTTCCGAKINTPTLRSHVGTVIDAWDSFSVFQTSLEHFPLFRPSVDTGLWPYPESSRVLRTEGVLITMFDSNEPPLAFNRDEAETLLNEKSAWRRPPSDSVRQKAYPALLSLMCRTKCHDYGVRTVTLRAPEGELRFRPGRFQTIWSKVNIGLATRPSPSRPPLPAAMSNRPMEGIWAGTYGAHGIEFVLLRYEPSAFQLTATGTSKHPHCNAHSMSDDHQLLDIVFYKITGDVNVPRGEVSCRAPLHDGRGNPYVRKPHRVVGQGEHDVDQDEDVHDGDAQNPPTHNHTRIAINANDFGPEFANASAFPGVGTVAMSGYRNPTKIPNDVIILSDTQVAVYWHDMGKISRFVKVNL